jgi:hypothetical protein
MECNNIKEVCQFIRGINENTDALFMVAQRAAYPVWTELLKQDLGLSQMSGIISKGTSLTYLSTICLPLLFSFWMKDIWRGLFPSLTPDGDF